MRKMSLRAAVAAVVLGPCITGSSIFAQGQPVNGMRPVDLRAHAITGATVVTRPGETIENATIIVRDGVIEAIAADLQAPADARQWDASGLTIYPGLIDAAVLVEAPDLNGSPTRHWNGNVRAEVTLADQPSADEGLRKTLRSLGFTTAAVYPKQGIFRGTGAVISLPEDSNHVLVHRERAAQSMGMRVSGGWGGGGEYPGSLMGVIALIRQTLLDAQWHAQCNEVFASHPVHNEPPAPADALAALEAVLAGEQPVLFDVDDELDALRAGRIAREFNLDLVLLGSGYEFRRLDEVASLEVPLIVPLKFPDRPEVSTMWQADTVSLREMMTWEQAPTNARRLHDAGVAIALTTERLDNRKDFRKALANAIEHGLSEEAALAALTVQPARLLGLDRLVGTIEPGKLADFVVVDGSLFDEKAKIRETWITGRRFEITPAPEKTLAMNGLLETDSGMSVRVDLDTEKPSAVFLLDIDELDTDEKEPEKVKAKKVTILKDQISIIVDGKALGVNGYVRLSGTHTDGSITGSGVMPDEQRFTFTIKPRPEEQEVIAAEDAEAEAPAEDAEGDADGASEAGGESTQVAETETETEKEKEPGKEDDGVSGLWALTFTVEQMGRSFPVEMNLDLQEDGSISGTLSMRGDEVDLTEGSFDPSTGRVAFVYEGRGGGVATLEGDITGDEIEGTVSSEMMDLEFSGQRSASAIAAGDGKRAKEKPPFQMPPDELVVPLGAYGLSEPLSGQDVLVRDATIWTAGPEGIIENGDLYIEGGMIKYVGPAATWEWDPGREPIVIDAAGKHVTPGLIDCHSHTGVSGSVNEFMQTNTAEVRIGDCIDPDDINWYRELAGGLTAANVLHGSANPIGGQNAVVKLKWGGSPDDFLIGDAPSGIKFALGENVKRSSGRYPNTRMGVETFIRDAFTAAKQYAAQWDRYESLPSEERAKRMPPRRDLEMEALLEVIQGERLVHCHSYRQDEILMLIRVAEDFGFTIGTFQHVLEGYKVAEAIAEHGAGASSFSDWWAYKVEVMDAIPQNGSLMSEVGVLVSFNSDSSELARRMNAEAAKGVRYGGMDPHEALKLVTMNPARQLRIDGRTGSLEAGKDGDFVIWSGDPLSTYSICEQTWIEGIRHFDRETDQRMREHARGERQRLVQKMLAGAYGEAPSAQDEPAEEQEKPAEMYGDLSDAARAWIENELRSGRDPFAHRPGDCGCGGFWQHAHQ